MYAYHTNYDETFYQIAFLITLQYLFDKISKLSINKYYKKYFSFRLIKVFGYLLTFVNEKY